MALSDEEYKTYMDLQEKIAADPEYKIQLIREEHARLKAESEKKQVERDNRESALAEGKAEKEKEVVINLHQKNMDINFIKDITALTQEKINNIIKEA